MAKRKTGEDLLNRETRVALVLGASGGIGGAIVDRLDSDGYRVVAQYRKGIERLKQRFSGNKNTVLVKNSLRSYNDCCRLCETVYKRFDGLDTVINAAGEIVSPAEIEKLDPEAWDGTLRSNLTLAFWISRAAYPWLVRSRDTRLIHISSIAAVYAGSKTSVHYGVAKAGLEVLVRALARDWSSKGIRVNAVRAGAIDTDIHKKIGRSAKQMKDRAARIPLGRLGKPAEVAACIAYLCSEEAAFLSGSIVGVTGGD